MPFSISKLSAIYIYNQRLPTLIIVFYPCIYYLWTEKRIINFINTKTGRGIRIFGATMETPNDFESKQAV